MTPLPLRSWYGSRLARKTALALAGPGDDMVGPIAGMHLVHHLAAHRLAGLVHGAAAAGDKGMPLWQALPLRQQAIGAGGG